MLGFRLGLVGKDDRGSVFNEIYATLIALASVWLLVVASGTLKGEGRVAARAEFGRVGRLGGAFRAFHISDSRGTGTRVAVEKGKTHGFVTVRSDSRVLTAGAAKVWFGMWAAGGELCGGAGIVAAFQGGQEVGDVHEALVAERLGHANDSAKRVSVRIVGRIG